MFVFYVHHELVRNVILTLALGPGWMEKALVREGLTAGLGRESMWGRHGLSELLHKSHGHAQPLRLY